MDRLRTLRLAQRLVPELPFERRFLAHSAQEQLACPNESRQPIQRSLQLRRGRQRFRIGGEMALQTPCRHRGVVVIVGEQGLIELLRAIRIAPVLGGARCPVAPARDISTRLRHVGNRLGGEAPLA